MHSRTQYRSPVDQRYSRVSTGIELGEQFEKARADGVHNSQLVDKGKMMVAVPHTGFIQYRMEEAPWKRTHYINDYKNQLRSASDLLLQKQQYFLQARKTGSWSCNHIMHMHEEELRMSRRAPELADATARSSWLHEDLAEITSPCPRTHISELPHEHLFYKVVTPSDVGKLNRLVIPKQHAERYLPIHPSHRKRGLLLCFRDMDVNVAAGKLWWFRYSYWSSSQSYVLTKGWIRFVKEKHLQAGDIISFERGMHDEFYISCRRKPTPLFERPAAAQHKFVACSSPNHSNSSSSTSLQQPSEGIHSHIDCSHHLLPQTDPLNSTSKLKLFGVDLRIQPPE